MFLWMLIVMIRIQRTGTEGMEFDLSICSDSFISFWHSGVPLTWILLPTQPLLGINAWSPTVSLWVCGHHLDSEAVLHAYMLTTVRDHRLMGE